jgi:Protein of unknown function (DUF4236)
MRGFRRRRLPPGGRTPGTGPWRPHVSVPASLAYRHNDIPAFVDTDVSGAARASCLFGGPMGFRMSKSIKLAPGVRMTVSKSGIGYSAGGGGYRVTKRASGAVTQTLSVPGTGLSHTSTISSAGRTGSSRNVAYPQTPAPSKPGVFAPRAEKALYDIVRKQDWGRLAALGAAHDTWRPLEVATDQGAPLEPRPYDERLAPHHAPEQRHQVMVEP